MAVALEEARIGRFDNARIYLQKGLDRCRDDDALADLQRDLERRSDELTRLEDFLRLSSMADEYAWDERDTDVILLADRALRHVNVYSHWDWWNHLTPLELNAETRDRLQQRAYRSLGLAAAMRLRRGMLQMVSATLFLQGGTEASRKDFRDAAVAIEAAMRFRPGAGLTFAAALCGVQSGETPGLAAIVAAAHREIEKLGRMENYTGAADRFFVGLSLLFAHVAQQDRIVKIAMQFVKLKEPLALATVAAPRRRHRAASQLLDGVRQ